jgi:hypothetical protein
MTPKIWASIKAIRAISHQFAQRQTAIRWLEWLHRKLSNKSDVACGARLAHVLLQHLEQLADRGLVFTLEEHFLFPPPC